MKFSDLRLVEPLLRALESEGYETPTPIQREAIPPVLEGRDLLGCAQTGTGKTAAFALPILQRMDAVVRDAPKGQRPVRVLVLTPTRELATQIGDSFATYGKHLPLHHTVIFGGVGQGAQVDALRRRPDVLVATPGRLLDLLSQKLLSLSGVEILVLDEADRMLDMGFVHDVKRVIAQVPKRRQTLFFSATMPPDIQDLASTILVDPVKVTVTPVSSTAEKIEQSIYFVDKADKRPLLQHVLGKLDYDRVLVFTRTKHGADRVVEYLAKARIAAAAIHGNKSQNARERALGGFRKGDVRVLVATDIAARGIDVDGVSHVVNFDLPNVPESYVHRIGRTARAGASGIALSFCEAEERPYLVDIERLIRMNVPVVTEHPWAVTPPAPTSLAPPPPRGQRGAGPRPGGRGGRPAPTERGRGPGGELGGQARATSATSAASGGTGDAPRRRRRRGRGGRGGRGGGGGGGPVVGGGTPGGRPLA